MVLTIFHDSGFQPLSYEFQYYSVAHSLFYEFEQFVVRDIVEISSNVDIHYPIYSFIVHDFVYPLNRLFGASFRSKSERTVFEVRFEYGFKDDFRCHLHQSVLENGDP